MKTSKVVSILAALLATTSIAAIAHAAGVLAVREATVAIGEREVDGAAARFACADVDDYDGWQIGYDCEGSVVAGRATAFRGATAVVALSPADGLGAIALPDDDGDTEKKVTCPGNQRLCGPGSKSHGACEKAHGGYSGSNPDSHGIPQTWSCDLP